MNIFYALVIFIVLFGGFNYLINAQPINNVDGSFDNTVFNSSENIDISGLKGLSMAFDVSTGNSFIDTLIGGFSILLVIALALYARGLL